MSAPMMFLLLLTTGMAVTGVAGYLIFGPLSYVQARDRGLRIGRHAFSPAFLVWIAGGRFRALGDPAISGLATPARILCWCFLLGIAGTGLILLPEALR
ncbi:MAG: hypothetical protein KatS3mg126_0617 [Lysobacteraceae bacterium]|nr:MAG: hypothetical protein KatS3mg126_0617 [Xanthomonadaceae bacterium]